MHSAKLAKRSHSPHQSIEQRCCNDAPSRDGRNSDGGVVEEILEGEAPLPCPYEQPQEESEADVIEALDADDL